MLKSVAFVLIVLLMNSSCSPIHSKPTGYKKQNPVWGSNYGYSEKKISADEYAIIADGNPKTSSERLVEIALYRAANLTREQGKTHFQIIQQKDEKLQNHELISIPFAWPVLFLPVAEKSTTERTAILIIRLLSSGSELPSEAIEADRVISELKNKF